MKLIILYKELIIDQLLLLCDEIAACWLGLGDKICFVYSSLPSVAIFYRHTTLFIMDDEMRPVYDLRKEMEFSDPCNGQ